MDYERHLEADAALTGTGESAQAARLSSFTARNQGEERSVPFSRRRGKERHHCAAECAAAGACGVK